RAGRAGKAAVALPPWENCREGVSAPSSLELSWRIIMKLDITSGAAIAAADAALLIAGTAMSAPQQMAADDAKGHCMGANACKGQSACKGAANACAGQNACKGKGFTEATKADCDKAGGKFEPTKS